MYTLIEPKTRPSSWLTELWRFRGLFANLVNRDIKVRYKDTSVGILWAVLQPLALTLVFSFLFGRHDSIAGSSPLPYPLLVFSGLIFWQFFSGSVSGASSAISANQSLVQKIYFPRILLPFSKIGVSAVDFFCCVLVTVAMIAVYGTESLSAVPNFAVAFVLVSLVSIGFGCIFSALGVRYKDMRFITPFFLQLTLFMSPVMYPSEIIGNVWVNSLNPLGGAISIARQGLLGAPLDFHALAISSVSALVIFSVGIVLFRRMEDDIADIM